MKRALWIGLAAAIVLTACGDVPPDIDTPPVVQNIEPTAATVEPLPGQTSAPASGSQRVTFALADGSQIVGTYYPPRIAPAPGVLLVHQMGMDRSAWAIMIEVLQGEASRSLAGGRDGDPNYAVFAIDLPGHGESGGTASDAAIAEATKLALNLFTTLDGVDGGRIVIMGASVGADAAVMECGEGCIGAVSLSPGNFLGVPYTDALKNIGERPVLCIASQDDGPSPATCEGGSTVGLKDYQVQIYDGAAHGNRIIIANPEMHPDPQPIPLIMEWLSLHAPLK